MGEIYPVGMAELRIAKAPDLLAVYGVGSCVIVAMFDPKTKIGGMSHVMLPDSAGLDQSRINPRKFADTAIPLLFQTLSHAGVFRGSIWAKVVGGAEMFPPTEDYNIQIGARNAAACIKALDTLGVPLLAQDVGGAIGRSVEFDLSSGTLFVTTLGEERKEI